jgi:large subunit ribosomal protein L5
MQNSQIYQNYLNQAVPKLKEQFQYKNPHEIPSIVKVTLNIGLGEAVQNPKVIDSAQEQLALICGQKPVVTRAKKSIAGFKLREGMPIGCMVTLRSHRMWNFLDKLIHIALPRVRDFRGISPRAFDGRGNYSMGLREQLIFPEIDFDKIDAVRGLNISINTTAQSDQESLALLDALGFPFRK